VNLSLIRSLSCARICAVDDIIGRSALCRVTLYLKEGPFGGKDCGKLFRHENDGIEGGKSVGFWPTESNPGFCCKVVGCVAMCAPCKRGNDVSSPLGKRKTRWGGGCREEDDLDGALSSLAMAGSSLAWSTIGLHGVGYITVSLWFLSCMVYNR
jgi:hypothetical protein